MAIDCSKPNLTQQEQNLCSCKLATETMVNTLNKYTADYTAYTDYITTRNAIIEKHNRWKNMTGEFANWATRKQQLIDERKTWNTCIAWSGVYGHDDWCRNDTGFAKQTGAGQHGCALGWGKGECQRDEGQVIEQLRREGYNALEPSIPSERQPPRFDSQNNIQCCSQIFNDINVQGGAAEFTNINQNCQQRITNELNKQVPTTATTTAASTTTAATTSAPTTAASTPTQESESQSTNQNTIIIIIIVVLFLLLLSSSSIGGIFILNTGEE